MRLIICIFFTFLPFFALGDTYFVDEVRGGAPYESANTFRELLRSELRVQRQNISDAPDDYSVWRLEPSLVKLRDAYIVSVSKIKGGRLYFSQKLKAQTLDDLDTVTERLVTALISNQSAKSAQRVNTVTKDELVGTTEKTAVETQFYFGFGPGTLGGLEADGSAVNVTAGYLWGIDHQFAMRLGLDWTNGDGDAGVLGLGLGGQYYFNLQKHAPYALGLAGFSWSESKVPELNCSNLLFSCGGEDETGWSAQVGLGMHFFRTAKVNLAFELAYTHSFYDVADQTPGVFVGRILFFW